MRFVNHHQHRVGLVQRAERFAARQTIATITDDAPLLSEISISTFYEAYAHNNDAAVMQSHTAQKFNPQQISLELQDANNQYYLAYNEGNAVGYLKLNLSDAANGLEIARIYARQTHWGRGVGQAL